MAKYKSKLGLIGIPRIEELRVNRVWFLFSSQDEFVLIADTLKAWKQKRKSLADYVEDQAHREALLEDLYNLRDWIALEVRREKAKPAEDQAHKFLDRREHFLRETVPYEEGRLLSWEPQIQRESRFDFEKLRGFCILTFENEAVIQLTIELQEAGLFSLYWKQAGDVSTAGEPIEKEIRIESRKAKLFRLSTPKHGGTIYIHDHTRKAVERVPL